MKIIQKNLARTWLFFDHDIDLQRYLDEYYNIEDHTFIHQRAWSNPLVWYNVINDYIRDNSDKINSVKSLMTQGKSKIMILVGKRGGGKTADAFYFAEMIKDERPVVFCGLPNPNLPNWIHYVKDPKLIPSGAFAILDETQIFFGARKFKDKDNIDIGNILTTLRHRDITILFLTQNSALIDINMERLADILIYKPVSLLQLQTERDSLKYLIAEEMIPRKKDETLFISLDDAGAYQTFIKFTHSLPDCWTDELSKPFRVISCENDKELFINELSKLNFTTEEIKHFLDMRGSLL